jgi:hypothetical protein
VKALMLIDDGSRTDRKVSNAERAAHAVDRFNAWVAERDSHVDWDDYLRAGKLNRSEIAAECGFGRAAWQQNPALSVALESVEARLVAQGILVTGDAPIDGPEALRANQTDALAEQSMRRAMAAKGKAEHRVKALEEQNAALKAEVRDLKDQLRRNQMREDHLSRTGRMLNP